MITKQTKDPQNLDYLTGQVILIDKPVNRTSFNVVSRVRRLTKVKKVGHAGTLDPLATGLLIVCTGKKTKEISEYQAQRKKYTGIITLGKSSPSMDLATEITETGLPDDLNEDKIFSVRNKFLGNIEQIPPMFSALKHKGKALYKLARAGKEVERALRQVEIFSFDITKIELPDIYFEIACSKGTYIRVIADDFGKELGCGGILSLLRRTEIGDYKVDDAFDLEEFTKEFNEVSKSAAGLI
jgi:tRNA pseudouridine55 synthase